jgi:hypothetical protein
MFQDVSSPREDKLSKAAVLGESIAARVIKLTDPINFNRTELENIMRTTPYVDFTHNYKDIKIKKTAFQSLISIRSTVSPNVSTLSERGCNIFISRLTKAMDAKWREGMTENIQLEWVLDDVEKIAYALVILRNRLKGFTDNLFKELLGESERNEKYDAFLDELKHKK